MKIPSRGFVRTLLKSTAGMVVGVPLLGAGTTNPQAAEPTTPVVRGQSQEDGGAISRWWGRRSAEQANGDAATAAPSPTMDNALAQAPEQNPSMFGRLLGSSDPNSPQSQRQMTRAQQKYFRRNPQMYQMYMLQQQLLLLQQQQQIQEQFEAEAVPSRESFDSLSIDPQEWADAPGRTISEDISSHSGSKPWWETGETPTNARRRQVTVEDFAEDVSPVPASPTLPEPANSASDIPDLFPAGDAAGPGGSPLAAPPPPRKVAPSEPPVAAMVPEITASATAAVEPATDFGLTFPTESPAASSVPAAAPPVAEVEPFPTAAIPAAPEEFIPPEPIGTAPAQAASPATASSDESSPFFAPAPAIVSEAPAAQEPMEPVPAAPAFPDSEPQLAAPTEETFVPPAPFESSAVVESSPVESSTPATQPEPPAAVAASVQPTEVPAAPSPTSVPATASSVPGSLSSTNEAPPAAPAAVDSDSPFTGLKLDDAPLVATPAPAEPTETVEATRPSEPVSNPFRPAAPAASVVEEPASSLIPPAPALEEPNPEYQFAPERTVAVPNPAPYIPPEPENYGQTFDRSPPLMAPSLSEEPELPAPTIAESAPALMAPGNDDASPSVDGGWTPDPLQAPDPIVAPSTARRLVAAPRPTQRETDSKIERISARRGLSGFKGFCPVALKDHRELLDARPEYSAVHNGRRYFFSSAAAQELFEAAPEQYVPAAMGNDVVHLMLTGESTSGSLEHAVWFRSRLYLFTSVETMETFVAAPSIHAREE